MKRTQPLFTGSYAASDVIFLLKPICIPSTGIREKEAMIQREGRHYSEFFTAESVPSLPYLKLFHAATQEADKMARDAFRLAEKIHRQFDSGSPITLVSLARAGTPVGVLLNRILEKHFEHDSRHFSVSIIRDRGIDQNALKSILNDFNRPPESIVFVDGWTGKGVIARELRRWITAFNAEFNVAINPGLYVLADLSNTAAVSATTEDYLIPSSILNATVSGLISRSILNTEYLSPDDFHGCVYYAEFADRDLSTAFVSDILSRLDAQLSSGVVQRHNEDVAAPSSVQVAELFAARERCLCKLLERFSIQDINFVKPGIGEATRVLLRRVPRLLLLKNLEEPQTRHLRQLALEKHVEVLEEPTLPYHAVSIITELD